MIINIKKRTSWTTVLNNARITVGKNDIDKEPSDKFKKQILIAEHSPIRNLLYEVTFESIKYWVAMHFRTHHIGFHSGEDDLFFIQTQRSDRTQKERDLLPQNTLVNLRIVINAHSIINVSRVRLCRQAAKDTRECWEQFISELENVEPILAKLCVPNCVYRCRCPEPLCCKYDSTEKFRIQKNQYLT